MLDMKGVEKILFRTKQEYSEYFSAAIVEVCKDSNDITEYLNILLDRLSQLIESINQDTFWILIPEILGIDAKLTLLIEALQFEDLSTFEIIRIVENDYRSYFKELCGYNLSKDSKCSILFNIT